MPVYLTDNSGNRLVDGSSNQLIATNDEEFTLIAGTGAYAIAGQEVTFSAPPTGLIVNFRHKRV